MARLCDAGPPCARLAERPWRAPSGPAACRPIRLEERPCRSTPPSRRSSTCWRASSPSRPAWPTPRRAPGSTSSCRSPTRPLPRRSTCATTRRPVRTARCRSASTRRRGGGADRPCLVWLHGGAFRMGDLDMPEADWTARQICDRAGAVVVSVDYRLCVGGVTYPVPHDDAVAAVRWVRDERGRPGRRPGAHLARRGQRRRQPRRRRHAQAARRRTAGCPPRCCSPTRPCTPSSRRRRRRWRRCSTEVPPLLRFLPEVRRGITENYLGGPASRADGYAMPGERGPRGPLPRAAAQLRVRRPARLGRGLRRPARRRRGRRPPGAGAAACCTAS